MGDTIEETNVEEKTGGGSGVGQTTLIAIVIVAAALVYFMFLRPTEVPTEVPTDVLTTTIAPRIDSDVAYNQTRIVNVLNSGVKDCEKVYGDARDPCLIDVCYYGRAINESKPGLCGRVKNPGMRKLCEEKTAKKIAGAETTSTTLSPLPKKSSECESLPRDNTLAITQCWYRLAYSRRDPSLCDNIASSSLRDRCVLKVEEVM